MENNAFLTNRFEDYYMNLMQIRANVVDANTQITEVARAGGKTEGVFGPRIIKVANEMPGELAFLVHKTYTASPSDVYVQVGGCRQARHRSKGAAGAFRREQSGSARPRRAAQGRRGSSRRQSS